MQNSLKYENKFTSTTDNIVGSVAEPNNALSWPLAIYDYVATSSIGRGYTYLWQGSSEIILQQLILDSIQDSLIKIAHNHLIKNANVEAHHGHSHGSIPTPFSLFKMIFSNHALSQTNQVHPLSHAHHQHAHADHQHCGGHGHAKIEPMHEHGQSFIKEFTEEFIFHFAIKLQATIAFPFVYQLKNLEINDSLKLPFKVISTTLEFFGINPLEGIYLLNEVSKPLFGEKNYINDNSIVNYFKTEYVSPRSENAAYGHYMDDYRTYMEFVDSMIHTYDNFDVYLNNDITKHLGIKAKAVVHLGILSLIYFNTESTQAEIDHAIYDGDNKNYYDNKISLISTEISNDH